MRLIFPCSFGLEKPLILELASADLGFVREQFSAQDGRVSYSLTEAEMEADCLARLAMRANLYSAIAERCILELLWLEDCREFDRFFEALRAFPWEAYIPEGACFLVDGSSTHSQLYGVPALQSLCKKAVVQRLLEAQGRDPEELLEENESKGRVLLRFAFSYDQLSVGVDLSGQTLHKRGYRLEGGEAPLKESLAAGILEYLHWPQRGQEALADLFCGSGTLAIEAARRLSRQAPGLRRTFALEDWGHFSQELIEEERRLARERHREALAELEAKGLVGEGAMILASDLDPEQIERARANAQRAGLETLIRFRVGDALEQDIRQLRAELGQERLLLLSNPPYGERLMEEAEVRALEAALGQNWLGAEGCLEEKLRWAVLTADAEFESQVGYCADKRRKLYNGMLACTLYQYFREGEHKSIQRRVAQRQEHGAERRDQRGHGGKARPGRQGGRHEQRTYGGSEASRLGRGPRRGDRASGRRGEASQGRGPRPEGRPWAEEERRPRQDRPWTEASEGGRGYERRETRGYGRREERGYGRREERGYGLREGRGYGRREGRGYERREGRGYERREGHGYERREERPVFRKSVEGWDERGPAKSTRVMRLSGEAPKPWGPKESRLEGQAAGERPRREGREGRGRDVSGPGGQRRSYGQGPARRNAGRSSWTRRTEGTRQRDGREDYAPDGPIQGRELLKKKAQGARLHQVKASPMKSRDQQED